MFQHYLKIAYRIFFKKKAYSLISLVGLVIAFSISFIILVFAYNEWRINKDYIYHNRIFRIISYDKIQDNRNALMSRDVATYIKSEIPEVAGVTRISRIRSQIIQDNESYEGYIIFVDPDFGSQ
jgi:ABC-type lipoprotein release transport system permease subunit